MSDSNRENAGRSSLDDLLAQDPSLSPEEFEEYRMSLIQTVEANEQAAARGRSNVIRGLIWLIVFWISAYVMNMVQAGPDSTFRIPTAVAVGWVVIGWGIYIFLAVVAVRYWTKQRPALDKSRTDLHLAMCDQLQRQIDDLKRTVGGS